MTPPSSTPPAVDRSVRPAPLPLPRLRIPAVQKGELSNGLPVWVVEQHRTSQVVLSIVLPCGASLDPAGKSGTATLTAELLDAGTSSRDALGISESVEFLGSSLSFRAGVDATFGTLVTLGRHLEDGLDLFAGVLRDPVFPEREFERVRRQRHTSLVQQKDRAAAIASVAIMRVVFGGDHPYGNDPSGTEESVLRLVREDIPSFYRNTYAPGNATMIVVGDVSFSRLLLLLDRMLGSWRGAPGPPAPDFPPPGGKTGGVFLIDKPGAPQSEIRIGSRALARNTRDYFPVALMNRVLGGQFSSRINLNLRERLGYTYGAHSSFVFLKEPGPFIVSGGFAASKTREAAEELFKEIETIHRDGITAEELEFSRRGLTGSLATAFETPYQIAGALQSIALYGLPDDYYDTYIANLDAVSLGDVRRVCRTLLNPAEMDLLVVGDASQVLPGLRSLGRGEPVVLDREGVRLRGPAPI